jgi:hypothetical protein
MSTWRPPWSAPGQFKLTLLPATRASNSVTASPPPGPGSTAALRAGSRGPLHPATCPPIWAGPAADHASAPMGPSPSGHAQPAQPQPPPSAPHEKGPGQASTDPMRPQRATGGYGEAEKRLPCLGGGTMRAWLCRCAMADAVPPVPDRWCAPSAKPELAPRTAAPPSSPGTTPLGAARCTKDGTGRR